MQDSGAPSTHDKPGSLTCPVYSTDKLEHFSLGRISSYLLLVILVSVRGDLTILGLEVKCFTTEPNPLILTYYPLSIPSKSLGGPILHKEGREMADDAGPDDAAYDIRPDLVPTHDLMVGFPLKKYRQPYE